MKLAIALLAFVGFVAAASLTTTKDVKIADKDFLQKQKFLFEIVYRVEDPLAFEEYIKHADKLIIDKTHYTQFDNYMEKFYESYKLGALLPKGEFFGALAKTHHKQAWGLFNFFYFAKDLDTLMKNICWARVHVNEGMFVYALTLTVIHRDDLQGLILPAIYEIFPQYFLNSKFVLEAEKFDYDVWSKYIMYEKEYKDILYKDTAADFENFYFHTKDWKTWQWWKMMGIGEHWNLEDKFMLRDYTDSYNKDSKWFDIMKGTQLFYMPVDYTRDIEIVNEQSKLSYFTEDLDWNAYWYYLNLDYSFFLDGKTFGLEKDRRGEYWIYNVHQILARYYLEGLSHGIGEIPELSLHHEIEHGYNPQLISYNGVGFTTRKNYWEIQYHGNFNMFHKIQNFIQRVYATIDQGFYKTLDGKIIDLRKPEAIEQLGNLLQGNVDTFDKFFFSYYYLSSHMMIADVKYHDIEVLPNVLLNFETMLRDPFFYIFYKQFTNVFYHFKYFLQPYTHEELELPGVTITDVTVDKLITYFDIADYDVTNLLNDKMTFEDGKFVWDKTLLARQARLNHKTFNFEYNLESNKAQKVVVRTFLGPKFDEYGSIISLSENRKNFIEIDEFVHTLTAGKNTIKRSSEDFYWTIDDRTTYTELYKYVMMASEGKYDFPINIGKPHCGFPDRLVLPHGWVKGLPMQFFFFVTPYTADHEQFSTYDASYYCGIGSGTRHIDELPFGYPFDREIDEYEFLVPNMYFKDVKVYHEDKFDKYFEKKYENYGKFDYSF